ncbi:hypothetical protein PTSG_12249 [Salpingoeca rosetta]|uniref:Uncharacterized protein n=1 Tax=Salpingoeca rosetta (strain ATCC 50818 / BSB-021) TaxID=946362 RepID=F2U9D6_SALR5|nr:uncharacterized protein PTSG_12249 [Salpingoeca rosetta]EGD73339.1 hypothetical protein PTSG_12249 [Salpingoeca rosetta]|eukprot:XP_004994369.1 hypothetical protein PTSG_12249 [Salpingoeca rosetta]
MMAQDDAAMPQLQDWEALQAKIFTKWVNQKLMSRHFPTINNVQSDLAKDNTLYNLMCALTDREPPVEKKKPAKMHVKAQVLDDIDKALKFVFDCGIQMKLKPSPENLYSGDFRDVMALVWAIMMKYIKFDEEDGQENLSAKDALLRWLQFHTKDYPQVKVENLTKSFHDGIAFCALIHKFKPGAIDLDSLDPANKAENLQLAMDKAEELFGIEKYLTPADILKLDEKSMLVYCSEYYYHINEQLKRDLAAKRISKLIAFTRENDETKARYVEQGEQLLQRVRTSEELLTGVDVIDNTMAGAKDRLHRFDTYKSEHKRSIVSIHLDMEATYNTLAMRLANHNRPEFVPENSELVLGTLTARIRDLQAKESVESQLHAELNRQTRLLQLDSQHATQAGKIVQWIEDKNQYLAGDFTVTSSGEARKQLKLFDSFVKESKAMQADPVQQLAKISKVLAEEKYERAAEASERESDIKTRFATLDQTAAEKEPVLKDNLARELFKEKVRLDVKVHTETFQSLQAWCAEKSAYATKKETVASVQAAHLQLSVLDALLTEKSDVEKGSVARLNSLGAAIRDAKYETQYSQWVYEDPAAVQKLEEDVQALLSTLEQQAAQKRTVLEDDLAREQERERIDLLVSNHRSQYEQLLAWAAKKIEYLETKETVESSSEAKKQLSKLELYEKEKADTTEGNVASLKAMGNEVRTTEYKTELSQWKYEKPDTLVALESEIDAKWQELDQKAAAKKAVLEDDLARELFAEQTRLMASTHSSSHDNLMSFAALKQKQYAEDIVVNSIADAQFLLSQLDSLEQERKTVQDSMVVSLKQLGKDILGRQYKTAHSSYTYENPAEITGHEAAVDEAFASRASEAAARQSTLQELLAKEERKEELRLEFASLAADFIRMTNDKIAEIGTQDEQKVMHGFSLDEVEAYETTLLSEEQELSNATAARQKEYKAALTEMDSLGVTENAYTKLTSADLDAAQGKLDAAVQARRSFYEQERERHRANDALCKQFADLVVPFEKQVSELMAKVLAASSTEEDQLALVTDNLNNADSVKLDFAAATQLEKSLAERGVESNPYTVLSVEDVQITWDNYMQVLQSRKPYLENVVAYKKYRGISPQQYEEMEQIFHSFDKDDSNSINERELRSCLFSLGEERTKAEIQAYMSQYGTAGNLSFQPFRELMITLLGDAGTPAGVNESFKVIARGRTAVAEEQLAELLSSDDVEYIKATARPAEEEPGYDFPAWIEEVFAR